MTYSWLNVRIADAEKTALQLGVTPSIRLSAEGSDHAIAEAEIKLGFPLPPSYREFLRLHDGAFVGIEILTSGRRVTSGVKIFSLAEMLKNTSAFRDIFACHDEEFWGQLIVIARTGAGLGDLCLIDPEQARSNGECAILDGFNETPDRWRKSPIADSFAEWLERMLISISADQHPEFWMPAPLIIPPEQA